MEMTVRFVQLEPPEGWVASGTAVERIRFSGWLGLLQALTELSERGGRLYSPLAGTRHEEDPPNRIK